MPVRAFIQRLLLTVLLFTALMPGSKLYAHRNHECVEAAAAQHFKGIAIASGKPQYHAPLDAVLSSTAHCSAAANLPGAPALGAGGSSALHCTIAVPDAHFSWEGETQLRRWRIMASAVCQDQLRALYPAHAFW